MLLGRKMRPVGVTREIIAALTLYDAKALPPPSCPKGGVTVGSGAQ